MKNKKQIKKENLTKKAKEKRNKRIILILCVIMFIGGIFSFMTIIYFFLAVQQHNQIIYNDTPITTEVCSEWLEYNLSYRENLNNYYYKNQSIPRDILFEVCPKWQNTKNSIIEELEDEE